MPMRIPLLALGLLAATLAGCSDERGPKGNGGPGPGGSSASCVADAPVAHTVVIQGSRYDPATVDGKLCDTIAWTNRDAVTHTVTADDGSFDVALPAGATEKLLFVEGGDHPYHCKIHPGMKGTVRSGGEGTIA